ncbi:TauD/TfdA family dioxygenase [Streptomyces sp. NPDC002088]|uniref:TauD/TfdA family dioxygenase n=1 Tax=Streptomyces sp. NPDC002088 TaxID=3154665 RepID=UPI0033196620
MLLSESLPVRFLCGTALVGAVSPADPWLKARAERQINAFHMDLVNGTLPPDYTTLLCVRPDPLGGGPSILSDAHAAVARLSEDSRALLAESAYHYGTFFDLVGVGEEYKPFSILDGSDPGEGFVRFTAKMLERASVNPAPLMPGSREHLCQRLPQPRASPPAFTPRGGCTLGRAGRAVPTSPRN